MWRRAPRDIQTDPLPRLTSQCCPVAAIPSKNSSHASKASPRRDLETGVEKPPVVAEWRRRRPREDVEPVAFVHLVRINVENVARAERESEAGHRLESELGVDEALAAVVLDVRAAVAVKGRTVLPVIGVASEPIPESAGELPGDGSAPRRPLLRHRQQSALVEFADQILARALKLRREWDVVFVRDDRASEVEAGVQAR